MKPNELSNEECYEIMCEVWNLDDASHVRICDREIVRAAYAAGAAAAVPKEPTPEMITAGREAIEAWGANGPVQVWQAMHDAATGVTK